MGNLSITLAVDMLPLSSQKKITLVLSKAKLAKLLFFVVTKTKNKINH